MVKSEPDQQVNRKNVLQNDENHGSRDAGVDLEQIGTRKLQLLVRFISQACQGGRVPSFPVIKNSLLVIELYSTYRTELLRFPSSN